MAAVAVLMPVAAGDHINLAALISDAERKRDADVEEVRSLRQYTMRNPRWKRDASMQAQMITSADGTKRYHVLSMSAEGLGRKILLKILDGEVEAAARKDRDGNVNAANYELRLLPAEATDGQTCRAVELIPKRRTRFTFDGRGCVDMNDMAMVRMEGRTAKSVSFLIGRAYVVQEFRKVEHLWYSSKSHSTADVKFLGKTELIIDYQNYTITPKPKQSAKTPGMTSPQVVAAAPQ